MSTVVDAPADTGEETPIAKEMATAVIARTPIGRALPTEMTILGFKLPQAPRQPR
jgi:hypothetical protein